MTLRVAIPDLVSPSYFPAIAAVELGFFRREGLDATLELVYPVTNCYEELREGRLDFVGGAAHATLYAFKDWAGCKLLCALAQNMYWFLVVRASLGAKLNKFFPGFFKLDGSRISLLSRLPRDSKLISEFGDAKLGLFGNALRFFGALAGLCNAISPG